MGILTWFMESVWANNLMLIFTILVLGYALGRITICGLDLGTAGVLLVALVFGHFGVVIPDVVGDLGLICFVTAVGYIAGPKFFRNIKANAKSYILIGLVTILSGALVCVAVIKLFNVPTDICVGLMSGALTSTPGLAAAKEAAGVNAAVGYGIAYPFGVVGVVLFVQLIPKILKTDMDAERAKFTAAATVSVEQKEEKKRIAIDEFGFFAFALAIILGIILAKISIPLPGGGKFALGTSGGPLLAGLVLGHFGHIGPVDIKPNTNMLKHIREFGLALFLLGAGLEGGAGFVEVLKEQGVMLFVYGALMTLVPMFAAYFFAAKVLKLSVFNSLGSICGGMTSTPALGTLIRVTKTDDVAAAYAATYPFALILVVLCCQFIGILF
ncbi:MAG: permease [Lachnospiraceae bacterium]|nr:permease [Lachnospiraceae bacterium]